MFAREGYPFILGAAALAALAFVMALRLRSWPLWLVAMVLTIVALCVAWFFRNPTRLDERGANVAVVPANGGVMLITSFTEPPRKHLLPTNATLRVFLGQRGGAGATVIADLLVT